MSTDAAGDGGDATMDDGAGDPLTYDTVILPARVASEVARKVAIASQREGVSVADLLGRAAAAFDWRTDDDTVSRQGRG